MKKITKPETTIETRWQCETCNNGYTDKRKIVCCPEHGEFCYDGDDRCSLSREVQDKDDKTQTWPVYCCPICGWVEPDMYDKGKGRLPRTKKEKASLREIQKWILNNSVKYSEYASFKRLKIEALKNKKWLEEIQKAAPREHDGIFVCQKCAHGIPTASSKKDKEMGLPKCELGRDNWLLQALLQDYDLPSVCSAFKVKIDKSLIPSLHKELYGENGGKN